MTQLLEYENQIFLDAFQDDGLLIMAKGLGIERIFTAFLKIYSDPGHLVLVLNTTDEEQEYFIDQLQSEGVKPLPKSIDAECPTDGRTNIYLQGGVLFITARILVIDLLIERIPIHLVTGILVYKAQRVIESCQEAFILRLYRQKNKTGFVKAFSDNPQSFTAGFCQVERIMKNLFVRKLYIWPRFQASVVALFDRFKIDVVEIHVEMTDAMLACQTALLNLIDACIKELKHCNRLLDTDDIKVEYAITKNFDKIIRNLVDPIWHQLSAKAKQLVADLKTLRVVLCHLTEYDCVNFYHVVHSIRSSEKIFGSNAGWLFTDAAESLFVNAKKRLYKLTDKSKVPKINKDSEASTSTLELQFEECPKWQALKDVLVEIEEDSQILPTADSSVCRVLVTAQDDNMCAQIKEYLCDGGTAMMLRQYKRLFTNNPINQGQEKETANRIELIAAGQDRVLRKGKTSPSKLPKDGRKGGKVKPIKKADNLTLTQMAGGGSGNKDEQSSLLDSAKVVSEPSDASIYRLNISPLTVLHPLRGSVDPHSFVKTLSEIMPRYVVLYDAEISVVRQLEVFKACHPDHPLRVYFLLFAKSVEEQRYLTVLRTEKEAFEYLIRQKSVMVVPEEREGKMENDPYLSRDPTPASAVVNTRKGGLQKSVQQQRIIVDMREFRSELPSLIHQRGIDIDPVTLEVGDYILTPDMCVERKSVSDLIGSLNNGRLFNQCVAMCRSYKRPVLLIEFDANKPFTLQDRYPISGEINSNDVISRLTLLTMHFPRLRLLWCPSPYVTAELFDELKAGRDQPRAQQAMAVTSDAEAASQYAGKYNSSPMDVLLKMPGITSKNVYRVMNSVESIAKLVALDQDELTEIMGSSGHAQQLYEFIHEDDKLQSKSGSVAEARSSSVKWKSEPARKSAKK